MNLVVFSGRLGQDPEVRNTGNGTTVATFSLAVREAKDTLWLNVVTFSGLADIVQKYLTKGREVIVTGRLKIEEYESNGQKKTAVKVVASSVDFVGGNKQDNQPSSKPANRNPNQDDEDIPF